MVFFICRGAIQCLELGVGLAMGERIYLNFSTRSVLGLGKLRHILLQVVHELIPVLDVLDGDGTFFFPSSSASLALILLSRMDEVSFE